MQTAVKNFTSELEKKKIGFNYDEIDGGKDWVLIRFAGQNCKAITTQFFFDPDGQSVGVKSFSICKTSDKKRMEALEYINSINARYRWLSFYIDVDGEIACDADAWITEDTAAGVCLNLLVRFITIIDDVYPELTKAVQD